MEACGSTNYWARKLIILGYSVKLIAAQFVKPYVKTNKNDKVDTETICESISRPNMRFVNIKRLNNKIVISLSVYRPPFSLYCIDLFNCLIKQLRLIRQNILVATIDFFDR